MIGESFLHYKVTGKLGEGGMGMVYLAEDTKLKREVALKFLPHYISANAEEHDRFKVEAQAAAALNHPNITQTYAIEESDKQIFIVMEYVRGKELKEIIQSNTLGIDEKNRITLQICEALKLAHEKGIIHRDIKSGNIMIDEGGNVKIMDFGLAKIPGSVQITKPGTTIGTTAYMSPEQITGESADKCSDIWSFGVLMYELYSGRLPFSGVYEQAMMYSILEEQPEPASEIAPDIPEHMVHVINRCLQKDRTKRYSSFGDIITELTKPDHQTIPDKIRTGNKRKRSKLTYVLLSLPAVILVLLLTYPPSLESIGSWLGFRKGTSAQHILILPLKNIGGSAKNQALCDGLMETLSSKVTELEQYQGNLWVVPASEVQRYNIYSPGEANKAFGVNLAVTGSLQMLQGVARLTLNLVDAKKMVQLNSTVIDVSSNNLALLQNSSVNKLLEMLNIELNPYVAETIQKGGTTVPGAFEYYLQGIAYLRRYEDESNVDNAIQLFKEAINADSSYALAYAALGEGYWRKFEAGKDSRYVPLARKSCEQALAISDGLVRVKVTMGLINLGTGEYKEAVSDFKSALDIDPKDAPAYCGLAKTYEVLDQLKKGGNTYLDKAEDTYKEAIRLKPDYWAGYNDLGVFYFRHSRYPEAVEQFKQVVHLTPDNYQGYSNLGGIYYMMEKWEQAREMFKHSLALKNNYFAASNLGTLNFILGNYAEASKMYETALKLNQNDYSVWGNLAISYYWTPGKRDKARQTYEKAIEVAEDHLKVNPKDYQAISSLAAFYADVDKKNQSLPLIKRSIKLGGDDPEIQFRTGTTYEKLGNRDEALHWIGKAIENGYSVSEIVNQPELKKLIADPRFQKMINKDNE